MGGGEGEVGEQRGLRAVGQFSLQTAKLAATWTQLVLRAGAHRQDLGPSLALVCKGGRDHCASDIW